MNTPQLAQNRIKQISFHKTKEVPWGVAAAAINQTIGTTQLEQMRIKQYNTHKPSIKR